jgi:hypothetical protein
MLGILISEFSELILLPHILVEASNLSRYIDNPAKRRIQSALKVLIATATELPILSSFGARRDEFDELGLTDAVILHLCSMNVNGISPTLITADTHLANSANSLGYSVIDYKQEYQTT